MAGDTIEGVKLEAKLKTDGSWHPCQVYLRSERGLSVKFEGQDLEDTILDVEDALSCLRVRSVPLQGDDCSHIEEGNFVLAAFEKGSQRLFFDAVVQKAIRVRHSKRASCRCTFMIKWQFEHTENAILNVPCSSILKRATESINSHPMVASFLNSMEKSDISSSSPTTFDDIEGEIDLHGLLSQIEDIGNCTGPSNESSLLGGGRNVQKNLASKQVRRSARRQNAAPPTIDEHIKSGLSSIEKSEQNQSPLNPLAARAVLASLLSKCPQQIEPNVLEERNCVSMLDYSKTVRVFGSSCTPVVNKIESFLTSEKGASGKNLHVQSNETLPMEFCNEIEPSINSGSSLSSSIRNKESIQRVVGSRITRSTMKQESAKSNQDDEATQVYENATFVRVTRSAVLRGKDYLADRIGGNLQDKKGRVTRSACSTTKDETNVADIEDTNRTLNEGGKFPILISSTTRLTRSAAHMGIKSLDDKANGLLQAKPKTESTQLEHSDSNHEGMVSSKKRKIPVINAEPELVESIKKQKGLVERSQNTTVDNLDSNVATQSQKSISSKNRNSRFAPHLRSSPRLQSHDKS